MIAGGDGETEVFGVHCETQEREEILTDLTFSLESILDSRQSWLRIRDINDKAQKSNQKINCSSVLLSRITLH